MYNVKNPCNFSIEGEETKNQLIYPTSVKQLWYLSWSSKLPHAYVPPFPPKKRKK